MSDLKPCPFCGSVRAPEVSDVGECEECSKFDDCGRRLENRTCEGCDRWERPMFVVCNYNISGCGASGPYRKTKAEAIAAWNSRADYHGYEKAAIEAWESIKAWNSRAERTCKQEERGWGTEGDHARVWLTCGHDCMVPTVQDLPNYCPSCGCKILRNTSKCSETTTEVVGE